MTRQQRTMLNIHQQQESDFQRTLDVCVCLFYGSVCVCLCYGSVCVCVSGGNSALAGV